MTNDPESEVGDLEGAAVGMFWAVVAGVLFTATVIYIALRAWVDKIKSRL